MSPQLVRGRYLLQGVGLAGDARLVRDGAVAHRDGTILEVGPFAELAPRYANADVLGSDRHIVLPGLINAHHHGRGLSPVQLGVPDDALESWLLGAYEQVPADRYLDTFYCNLRLIESGVTTVIHSHSLFNAADFDSEMEAMVRAYREAGLRAVFALRARNQNFLAYGDDDGFIASLPEVLRPAVRDLVTGGPMSDDDFFATFERVYRRYHSDRFRVFLGPLAPQWCSDAILQRIVRAAEEYDTGIHTHLLETRYQRLYGRRAYGHGLVPHLRDIGLLGPRVSFAHTVWLTSEDIRILAEAGSSVCHNPGSNLRLRSGVAPVLRMLEAGLNVALGMDSHGLNDDDDMWQEMRLCHHLHRPPGLEQQVLTAAQLLHLATAAGAKAALWEGQIGSLDTGKRADLVLVDLGAAGFPYTDPRIDPL
ncbi:MAG: amidohydrolase family protein, partial [Chloroflexi bacterium]|nr:amidohydrolase family protein [Chloroflexota bacterium]